MIRLSVLGAVSKPGFYQLDSGMLLSDALQAAGGIGNSTDLHNSTIKRGEEEIVAKEVFYEAITVGRTLDALNLRAGDEIDGRSQEHDGLVCDSTHVRDHPGPHHQPVWTRQAVRAL